MAGTDILFRYTVAAAGPISIGVYADAACEKQLLRTISSAVHHEPGQYIGYWDGRSTRGDIVSQPLTRGILAQANNVKYEFQGVIGNSSQALSGPTTWDMVHNPPKMCFAGQWGYVASAYIEGEDVGYRKFDVNNPQVSIRLHERDEHATRWVCTDGNLVYWLGFDGPQNSMIAATRVSDDSAWTFSAGTQLNLSHSSYSAIGLTYNGQYVTGGAVQRNGRFLVASYKTLNQLWVFDKLSGGRLFTVPVDAPRELSFATDDVLWVIHGEANPVCEKFTVTAEGAFAATGVTLSGLVDPIDVASTFDGSIVAAIDSSRTHDHTTTARHRVHAYNGTSGEVAWTFGRSEGYEDARVYPDKFCLINTKTFEQTTIGQSAAWLAFEPDGHLWVGDIGNHRSLRFSPQREYVTKIEAVGYFYAAACDPGAPENVYGNWCRWKVGYPGLTWELTHNYAAYLRQAYDDYANRFLNVTTFPSGRTYWLAQSQDRSSRTLPKMFVEVTNTKLVYTNQFTEHVNVALNKDGSLTNVEPVYNGPNLEFGRLGDPQVINQRFLTSDPADPTQFPTWGAKQHVETVPPVDILHPVSSSYPLGANQRTASGKWVTFSRDSAYDGLDQNGRVKYKVRGTGDHLGILENGEYLVKTSPSTPYNFAGKYPLDGAYDNGNSVQGMGDRMEVVDKEIFWHAHAEFRLGKQVTETAHYRDNGLLVAVFGEEGRPGRGPSPLGLSSNATSGTYVRAGADAYYYSNTEGYLGGIHRWRISNLASITTQLCAPQLGTLGTNARGADQLAGLPQYGTLVDGTAGWFRSPATDTSDFQVQTGLYETSRLDVSVRARPNFATGTPVRTSRVGRKLPAMVARGPWQLTGTMRFLLGSYDELGDTAPFEIPDKNGKAIIRATRPNRNSVRQLEVNGQVVGGYDPDAWDAQMRGDALLDAGIDEAGLYVAYAGFPKFYPAATADAGADMLSPAAYQFRTQLTANSGREYGVGFTGVRFLDKQAPVTATTFNSTTTPPPTPDPAPARMAATVPAPAPTADQLLTTTLSAAAQAHRAAGGQVLLRVRLPRGMAGPWLLVDAGSGAQQSATITSAAYECPATGAQTIAQTGAAWFGDVGIRTAGGKSIPLDYGTGYTYVASELTVLAAAGAQAGDVVTYSYATAGVGAGQVGGPTYTAGANIAISAANVISVTGKADEDARFSLITPADPATPVSSLTWRYLGNPALANISLGPFDPNSTLGADVYRCTFGAGMYYCEFGEGLTYSTFGNAQISLKIGDGCSYITHETGCREVYYGEGCAYITVGKGVESCRIGDNCTNIEIATGVSYLTLGAGVKNCLIGAGCTAVRLGAGCERVEVHNCGGAGYSNTAPFDIPAGTRDVVYRNNVPVSAGVGIDYTNPVTLSAAATLSPNKAYYLTGSGYPLTLPAGGSNLGAAIYVEVAAGATGLYAVGAQLLRAGESFIVRATPGGWAISTKQLVPLVARVETTLNQQDAFNGVFFVPFSKVVQDAVGMATLPGVTIRRSGQYILTTGGALKGASGSDQNVISLLANPNTPQEQLLVSAGTAITGSGVGDAFVTYTGYLEAGTVLRTRFYCGAGAQLRGQFDGAQMFLTITEIA